MEIQSLPDLQERFHAMNMQEVSYVCGNYLSRDYSRDDGVLETSMQSNGDATTTTSTSYSNGTSTTGVNEIWREKICEWSFQVVDHFDFNREIVEVSLSYLDRYLSSRQVNKKIFQLAAMTTLYLAIKLYENRSLKITSLIELSRGKFVPEHVAAMEESILRSLSWHVHPPTTLSFVHHLLLLIPDSCPPTVKHDILELARFLSELSICDYFFVLQKRSSIAIAALLNALDTIPEERLPLRSRRLFYEAMAQVTNLDYNSEEILSCRTRLRDMYYQGEYHYHHQGDLPLTPQRGPSPQGVSDFPERHHGKVYVTKI